MPLAVVQKRLDRTWDGCQAAGELLPCARIQAPFACGLAAALVVDEAAGGVQLRRETAQGRGEVVGAVVTEPLGQVGCVLVRGSGGPDAEVARGVSHGFRRLPTARG